MFFRRIFTPQLAINSYLIGDEKTKKCVVIDPTRHVVSYIIEAQNAGFDITAILETHVHADFASGARELKHQLNEKPRIYASGLGGKEWLPSYADEAVAEGTLLELGDFHLKALHTPGHSPEHVMWVCYDDTRSRDIPCFAFTGDCVFVGSVGRPDLLNNMQLSKQLYHTLFEVLSSLPDFMEIFPTHGEGSLCGKSLKGRPSSTLGYERLCNPYFKKEKYELWLKNLEEGLPPIPPYFHHVKKLNVEGPPLLSRLKTARWGEGKDAPSFEKMFFVDIRLPELFAASFLEGSLNIPFSASFSQWAGWMLPVKTPIGLIVENLHFITEVVDQLRLMGFDQDIWVLTWEEVSSLVLKKDSFPMIEPQELAAKKAEMMIVDVRTLAEWNTGHIPHAHHHELIHLESELEKNSPDKPIAVICASGQRASLGASLLKKRGFKNVQNVRGGMLGWKLLGLPMEAT